jgi:copper chaperone CopZ
MIRFVLLFAAFTSVLGCSDSLPVEVVVEERVADIEKTVARIGVEGMMCEIACGGKIRKELSELSGVASASVEFMEGESVNYALVEFNPELISERELIETINGISDGRLYNVSEMVITRYAPSGDHAHASGHDGVNMKTPQFVVPGILDVLWNLVGGLRH